MKEFLLLITMIFCHIVDDYYLQGILASMKQKDWWKDHYPDRMYRHDYLAALITHAFSWAFMVHLPAVVYMYMFKSEWNFVSFIFLFVSEIAIHAWVDHAKANKKEISLVSDQICHIIQIIGIWVLFISLK